MYNDFRKQIVHFIDLEDYEIKQKAHDLSLPKGWDTIPTKRVGKWAATSILAYRENNIWLFKFDPRWTDGHYDLTLFKDYPNHPGLEDFAWEVVWTEGGVERLPMEVTLN